MSELIILVLGIVIGYIVSYRVPHPDAYMYFESWNERREKMPAVDTKSKTRSLEGWNYRLIKHTAAGPVRDFWPDVWYSIHTVYYYHNGIIASHGDPPATPNEFETPDQVKDTLHMMLEAFDKPVLEIGKDGSLVEVK
jgi:hypothetical protein